MAKETIDTIGEDARLTPSNKRHRNDYCIKAQTMTNRINIINMETYGYSSVFFIVRQVNAWGHWQEVECYHTGKTPYIKRMARNVLNEGQWLLIHGTIIHKKAMSNSAYMVDVRSAEPILSKLYSMPLPGEDARPKQPAKPTVKMRRVDCDR